MPNLEFYREQDDKTLLALIAQKVDQLCAEKIPALESTVAAVVHTVSINSNRITIIETKCNEREKLGMQDGSCYQFGLPKRTLAIAGGTVITAQGIVTTIVIVVGKLTGWW